jgi:DNA-binding NarL/FixJ family response regulator
LWPGLLDGWYTIVDRVKCGEELLLVARRNLGTEARGLRVSALERGILEATRAGTLLKVIALELGWSQARVSRTLSGRLRKLGLHNMRELTLASVSTHVCTVIGDEPVRGGRRVFGVRGSCVEELVVLTAAEREVTGLMLRGLSNREIAARRGRSVRTVANQVARILEKMGVPNRRALVARLMRAGLAEGGAP